MRTIFETCVPRQEVLRGELRDDLFAASLASVVQGTADPVYGDPEHFFSQTYPTKQLQTLLRDVLARLTQGDPAASPVLVLETPFGGGKTHALIALYHAARGASAAATVIDRGLLPSPGEVAVAAVVGTDLDPTSGVPHHDVTTYTLWGELAYQLGGRAAYRLVEESDHRTKTAPGRATLEQLVGERPVLILLDELARYLSVAEGVATPTERKTLAEQTIAFLHALLELAGARRNVLVVLTMASGTDAYHRETERLRDLHSIAARTARFLTPAEPEEIPAIVVHRLFERVDRTAARDTAQEYLEAFRRWAGQEVNLPPQFTQSEFAQRIERSYPFHPELIHVLNTRVGSIPNFQRTRGALRLLARVVRRLWEQQSTQLWLIHPGDVDLGDSDILEDLTSRLDRPMFKQVAEADIASRDRNNPAHAEKIDEGRSDLRPARRLATTIFLHSLELVGSSGIDEPSLLAATLRPDDQPDTLSRVLNELRQQCWFLMTIDERPRRYRFVTEPQLQKMIDDERSRVSRSAAKELICQRIREMFKPSVLQPVFFPSEPGDIPDGDERPHLAILHFDAVATSAEEETAPDLVRKLFEEAGPNRFRQYRNYVVFLVADEQGVDRVVEQARTLLAMEQLLSSRHELLDQRKWDELQRRKEGQELELRVGITRTYRFLYYPQGGEGSNGVPLYREILPVQEQGTVQRNQTTVIEQRLRELEKLRRADDQKGLPAPAYVRRQAFGTQEYLSTVDLRRAFARLTALPILADAANAVRELIEKGISAGVWVYYDAEADEAYDAASGRTPSVRLAENTFVYLPEAAERQGLRRASPARPDQLVREAKSELVERCPVCHEPQDQCRCADDLALPRIAPWQPVDRKGTVVQVFRELMDVVQDQRLVRLTDLQLQLEAGDQKKVRAFGIWLSQLASLRQLQPKLEAQWTVTLSQDGEMSLRYSGALDQYQRYRTSFEAILGEAQYCDIHFTLRLPELAAEDVSKLLDLGADEIAAELGQVHLSAKGYRE